ncbi:MAG: 50S ribosomal protein L4 [Nitrospiraceae bacterium]
MPSVDVVDLSKRKVGTAELPAVIFGHTPNKVLVHEAVVMQRAGERQGTASTLRRGEVSGSGKKPWKQKHTGRARAGSLRSPVWRHGGSVFGPKPRTYGYGIPKQKYHRALQMALSSKVADGDVIVVDDLTVASPKTRQLEKVLGQLGVKRTCLLVVGEGAGNVVRAARNLSGVKVVSPERLNIYDVLRYESLVMAQPILSRIQEAWA